MEPATAYLAGIVAISTMWVVTERAWNLVLELANRPHRAIPIRRIARHLAVCIIAVSLLRVSVAAATVTPQHHRIVIADDTSPSVSTRWSFGDVEDDRPSPIVPRDVHVVERGDTLWAIAKQILISRNESASGAAVSDYWRAIYERNRAVIGDNPNLILPGQVLELPTR